MIDYTQTKLRRYKYVPLPCQGRSPVGTLIRSMVYLLMPPQIVIRGGKKVRQDPSIGMSGVRGIPKVFSMCR